MALPARARSPGWCSGPPSAKTAPTIFFKFCTRSRINYLPNMREFWELRHRRFFVTVENAHFRLICLTLRHFDRFSRLAFSYIYLSMTPPHRPPHFPSSPRSAKTAPTIFFKFCTRSRINYLPIVRDLWSSAMCRFFATTKKARPRILWRSNMELRGKMK